MKIGFEVKLREQKVAIELIDAPEWEAFLKKGGGACYEPEVVNAMMRFVKPGDYVIDCGANLGFFTTILSQLVGPTGEVLAFEPDPKFFARLKANLALNHAENVQTFDTVLWHADEEGVGFYLNELGGYSSVLHYSCGTTDSLTVTARSLDSFINDEETKFRLIKIDCEGAEERILHGAERLLRTGIDCVILEMNPHLMPHMNTSETIIRDYMRSLGYDLFLLNPYGDPPVPFSSGDVLISPGKDEDFIFNVLFSTKEKVNAAWNDLKVAAA
jgi:FkbM family methyltransferase